VGEVGEGWKEVGERRKSRDQEFGEALGGVGEPLRRMSIRRRGARGRDFGSGGMRVVSMGWKATEGRRMSSRISLMVKAACGNIRTGWGIGKRGRVACLHRTTAADDVHPLDLALGEGLDGVLGNVGLAKYVDVLEQHAGDVQGYISLADDHGLFALGKIRGEVRVLREAVVPADELAS
jgi:hypothetical protein